MNSIRSIVSRILKENDSYRYFDVHVVEDYEDNTGFSLPVKIKEGTFEIDGYDYADVINWAVKNDLLDSEDARNVDNVEEIDWHEYKMMKGIR